MERHKAHTVKQITLLLDRDLGWKFFGNKIMSLFLLLIIYLCFMHVTNSYWKTPQNSNSDITQPILNLSSLKTSIPAQGNKYRYILEETEY